MQIIFSLCLLFSSVQASADVNPWPLPENYMKHWYVIPTGPDDGEFVITTAEIIHSEVSSGIVRIELNFEPKSQNFKQLGGWMQGISRSTLHVPLINENEEFGNTKGTAEVVFENTAPGNYEVDCNQLRQQGQGMLIQCWFNGFDSIRFISKLPNRKKNEGASL